MRDKIIVSALVFVLMVVLGVGIVTARNQQEAVAAAPMVGAEPKIDACIPPVICPTITVSVTLPPVTVTALLPGRTITVGGGTRTITLPPRGRIETVKVPGPRTTRTIREPGGLRTVTSRSTITIERRINATNTTTRTVRAPSRSRTVTSGQSTVTRSTMVTTPVTTVVTKSRTIPGTPIRIETVKRVGVGLLSALAILALVFLGMWYGWHEGRKTGVTDADEKNLGFLQTLREAVRRPQGRHR